MPRNEAEGAVMSQNIDRKSVCMLIQALSTASLPVSGRLARFFMLLFFFIFLFDLAEHDGIDRRCYDDGHHDEGDQTVYHDVIHVAVGS